MRIPIRVRFERNRIGEHAVQPHGCQSQRQHGEGAQQHGQETVLPRHPVANLIQGAYPADGDIAVHAGDPGPDGLRKLHRIAGGPHK
jgi:hypothetical protein